jgi:hypothetical protein
MESEASREYLLRWRAEGVADEVARRTADLRTHLLVEEIRAARQRSPTFIGRAERPLAAAPPILQLNRSGYENEIGLQIIRQQ